MRNRRSEWLPHSPRNSGPSAVTTDHVGNHRQVGQIKHHNHPDVSQMGPEQALARGAK